MSAAILAQRTALPRRGLLALYDFLDGTGQTLLDRSVLGIGRNLLVSEQTNLGSWDLGGTPIPIYSSVTNRLTFGATGTSNYAILTVGSHPGASQPITITVKAKGNGSASLFFTDNVVGNGSNPLTNMSLTDTFVEFTHSTTWPAFTSAPIAVGIQRNASNTATYIEVTDIMVNYGSRIPYEHPLYNGALGSSSGVEATDPVWTSSGLAFDGVDDIVTLPSVNVGPEHTLIVVSTPTDFVNFRIPLGAQAIGTQLGYLITDGTSFTTINDFEGQKYLPFNNATAGVVSMLTKRVSQAGQYFDLHLNTNKSERSGTVGVHNSGTNVMTMFGAGGGVNFLGGIHYAAFYNRVLSDAEVQKAYRAIRKTLMARGVALP